MENTDELIRKISRKHIPANNIVEIFAYDLNTIKRNELEKDLKLLLEGRGEEIDFKTYSASGSTGPR